MSASHFLRPEFVDSFPFTMESGVLYVSTAYNTCGHLCCCGCGHEVVTPLSPAQWSFTYDGENLSLNPSVGNWALPCRSHYWIRKGTVQWTRRYSSDEISENRIRDRQELAQQDDEVRFGRFAGLRRRFGMWR